ncbi:MAG: recombination protein RecR [Chitinophagaceae bacterium]|jgi:recombination protein RecR|nr:recombination protein RecR [Chitinophagaceae bacterium]
MNLSSHLLESAVKEFSKLPGIGKKTALRLVLHLLKQEQTEVAQFSETISRMREDIKFCSTCFNISDQEQCTICKNALRKRDMVCVVESIRDVIAIESTEQYNGLYHVLGGVISPLDGVGPDQLTIASLAERVVNEGISEVVFALSPTIQGDTTIYYIRKKLNKPDLRFTTIARGIAFGGELEYADEMTLAKSIRNRLPVDSYIQ